jgi:site-specific recombinase XerD
MTALAPIMEGFFTERLIGQRRASGHTIASYRDTFRLLLAFIQDRTGTSPSRLALADLDATVIAAFLDHLETGRHNSIRTRNNRLAAIHSLFAYAALQAPEHAEVIARVLAIPSKRTERPLICFLTDNEVNALLAAPDTNTRLGRRDHALLLVAIQSGLRVSELAALSWVDVELGTGAHLRCHGKGRKDRITPLTTQTTAVLADWQTEAIPTPNDPVFPSRRQPSRLSRDGIAAIVTRHANTAAAHCPSLDSKNVTPHVLRHTCAMRLLAVGVDISVIALWLGHESIETTQMYLHADLTIKERALARTTHPGTPPGRYQAPDTLLVFLDSL